MSFGKCLPWQGWPKSKWDSRLRGWRWFRCLGKGAKWGAGLRPAGCPPPVSLLLGTHPLGPLPRIMLIGSQTLTSLCQPFLPLRDGSAFFTCYHLTSWNVSFNNGSKLPPSKTIRFQQRRKNPVTLFRAPGQKDIETSPTEIVFLPVHLFRLVLPLKALYWNSVVQ
jgi:hypothetical protein